MSMFCDEKQIYDLYVQLSLGFLQFNANFHQKDHLYITQEMTYKTGIGFSLYKTHIDFRSTS